jgi:outer membrane protein
MNKVALGLSILSIVMASVLLYMQFSTGKKSGKAANEAVAKDDPRDEFRIAYFEMDSVENNYEYVKEIREILRKEEDDMNTKLRNRKSSYQREIAEWQKKGPNISQAESEQMNKRYQQMQVDFENEEAQLKDKLNSTGQKLLMDVNQKIAAYLKEYNKDKGYHYIITNEQSLIYYKDSAYNITQDLVTGLNALYKAKKKN